jgi:hypothetical protein
MAMFPFCVLLDAALIRWWWQIGTRGDRLGLTT